MGRPLAVIAMVPMIVSDEFGFGQRERLHRLCEVPEHEPLLSFAGDEQRSLLANAEILISGWGCPPLDAVALAAAPKLRLVAHAAGTVKPIVTDAVWQRNLFVTSAAAANAVPVSEFTLAAILFANKGVFLLQGRYKEQRASRWPWTDEVPDLGNLDKTVGLIGASHIGRRVIELLRPFDLHVQVSDPLLDAEEAAALGVRLADLDDLLATSDVVSLHAPLLPETKHLLDARRLRLLRDGSTVINTARGEIIDQDALVSELVSGRVNAVLDTTCPEILPADSPLYELPNAFVTPHIAGSFGRETRRMADLVLDEIERYVAGTPLAHQVTARDLGTLA